jgi:7,8-dihydro-6-hydroxymethylpterin-pyrophosphokinase
MTRQPELTIELTMDLEQQVVASSLAVEHGLVRKRPFFLSPLCEKSKPIIIPKTGSGHKHKETFQTP